MAHWQMQQSKARLGELIEDAHIRGPRIITWHGAERAVVLSIEDYRTLVSRKPSLIEYLLGGPKVESFSIESSRDMGREIEL